MTPRYSFTQWGRCVRFRIGGAVVAVLVLAGCGSTITTPPSSTAAPSSAAEPTPNLPAGDLANQCRLAGEIITWQGTWNGFDAVPSNIGLDASQLQNYSGPPFGSISPSLGHDIFTIDVATSVDASMITALSNDVATLLADWQAAGCK